MNVETVKKMMRAVTPQHHRWKIELLSRWNEVVGKFDKMVQLEGFSQNCIFIGVTNSCLTKELLMQKELIHQRIANIVGTSQFFEIKIRLSAKKCILNAIKKKKSLVCRKNLEKAANLSSEEERVLAKIKTESLREAMQSFWIRCKKVSLLKK